MSDLITISSSVLPYSARVVGFRGTEAISRPYHFEIFVQLRRELGEEFDLADAIGAKAKLVLDRGQPGMKPFVFAGVFANVEVLHAYEGHVLLRAELVPRLWQLGLSRHSRIFTKMRIVDVITTILEENGITEYEKRLGNYEVEEHVCQYMESDLDFISRWMEREGIYYFFEHGEDGEKLILCDDLLYDQDELGTPVRYFPQVGHDHSAGPHFRSFTGRQTTLPTSVRLKDYDYAKPNLNVAGKAKVASNGAGEVNVYGGRFFSPSAGDRLAKIRAEEMLTRQAVYRGAGTRMHLRTGYAFELDDHPFPSFNTKYLTIEARHSGNQAAGLGSFRELMKLDHEDVYVVEVDAIPAKTQFRPVSATPWPRIYGYENGVVDGPAESEYAQIDEQGRYNCKFKFDESSLKNGRATTWVRMMQPHGGDIEGFHFPLRKGTEVIVSFLGGDCDRPVIIGVVPNAVNPSPVTEANYTKNVIQTGGRNRFEIEDLAGGQWIHLSTPASSTHLFMGTIGEGDHNFILETQGTGHLHTHGKMDVNVEGTLTETVVQAVSETYDSTVTQSVTGTKTTTVDGLVTETYNAGQTSTVNGGPRVSTFTVGEQKTITGYLTETLQGPHTSTFTGPETRTVIGPQITQITGTQNYTVTSNQTVHVGGNKTHDIDGNSALTVTGTTSQTHTGAMTVHRASSYSETQTGSWFTLKADDHLSITGGAKTDIFGGLDLSVTAGLYMSITAALKLSLELGVAIDLNSAVSLSIAPCKIDEDAINVGTFGAKIKSLGAALSSGGLENKVMGLINHM